MNFFKIELRGEYQNEFPACTAKDDKEQSLCKFYAYDPNGGWCKYSTSKSGEFGDWCLSSAAKADAINVAKREAENEK